MNRKIINLLYLVPLIYLGLITYFVYLQFFSFKNITEKAGPITINAEVKDTGSNTQDISKITISLDSVSFIFSGKDPLRITLKDGSEKTAVVKNYSLDPEGGEINFTGNVLLDIHKKEENKVHLSFSPGDFSQNAFAFTIPYRINDTFTAETTGKIPILSITGKEGRNFLTASGNSRFSSDTSELVLAAGAGAVSPLDYYTGTDRDTNPLQFWFSSFGVTVSPKEYDKKFAIYLDAAFYGWAKGRFDNSTGNWKTPNGPSFDENIINAYLAESVRRGVLPAAIEKITLAAAKHENELTIKTSPYLGDIVNKASFYHENSPAIITNLTNLLNSEKPVLFQYPDLFSFAAIHGPSSLPDKIVEFAEKSSVQNLSPDTAPYLLKTFIDGEGFGNSKKSINFASLIEKSILPSIAKTSSGFFLTGTDGKVNTFTSVLTGILLDKIGKKEGVPLYSSLGKSLVAAVLSLGDEAGYIPVALDISQNNINSEGGYIGPESIYNLLSDNPYYPREVPLKTVNDTRFWIRTCAKISSISSDQEKMVIRFSFPPGVPHHFILQGLPPFKGIQLYGIDWVSDPRFQSYSSGWLYEEKTQTLFGKIRHRREEEEVTIFF